ncbi:MAG: metallophosphoesterase [Opitutaceae bacterium]|nr:metallophosphoesterase [Opitutaceae bacterium]
MPRALRLLLAGIALAALARAADLDLPPAGAFTIVVIPDTQGYRGRATKATPQSTEPLTNPVFQNHTRWIAENLRAQNIVFVSHVGDIVDINNAEQWTLARECLDRLHGVVPYSLTVGNHDMTSKGDASLYQRFFPAERFRAFAWYGGSYGHDRSEQNVSANNVNSHQLFSAGGLDFIHLSLECNAPDDVLAWADGLLRQHAGRRAIVTTHMDLGPIERPKDNEGYIKDPKGRMNWVKIHGARGNSAVQMWEKLFRRHANLGFIFSGDQSRTTAMRLAARGDAGNTVHSLLSDYTSSGPLRVYRFVPSANEVRVITYDTTRRALVDSTTHVEARDQHQFTLPYAMKP